MRKLIALPLMAAFACGGSFRDRSRDALPSKDTVSMGAPGGGGGGTSKALTLDSPAADSTLGVHSPFFDLTVGVTAAFNGGAAIMLGIVESVTAQQPTSCTQTSCTWGPGSGPLDYNNFKLVVSEAGDGYDWQLSGQAKSRPASDFVTFMSGHAVPGPQPHHGTGSFAVDFDQAATLDGPHDATGKLTVSAYSNVGPAHLDATYLGAKDNQHAGQFENIVYSYGSDSLGGGDLDFAVHNTTSNDSYSVHSRWKNGGAGRADVQGTGGGVSVKLSECWGAAPFNVVYFNSSITLTLPPFGGPAQGAVTACAYTSDAFSTKTAP